ncbi:hypothetical protein IW15_14905 [Chryseobacterium soli]|uniref:Uncharacterized protein n=1 Tax=Chryseobacterium soli TaxID=445961 RepID=A0A086A490_9FLAO|nr:hypothetical protein [Chryseobacterium soli]KFF11504.1 hypothetical protein IW15_14905 [Chryseobacterium soli]
MKEKQEKKLSLKKSQMTKISNQSLSSIKGGLAQCSGSVFHTGTTVGTDTGVSQNVIEDVKDSYN